MSRVRRLAINAADHLVRKGRLDAAASILENYLSAHSECAGIVRRLGRIRLQQGRPDLAEPLLKRALALYSTPAQEPNLSHTGSHEAVIEID